MRYSKLSARRGGGGHGQEIVQCRALPFRLPMPREPSAAEEAAGCAGLPSAARPVPAAATGGAGGSSRKAADGTKNRPPVPGGREIEDPVVAAGRAADEHVHQHLLGDGGRGRIADEVGTELALPRAAEQHVVPHDLALGAVRPVDRSQREVGAGGLDVIGQLDVGLRETARPRTLPGGGRHHARHRGRSCGRYRLRRVAGRNFSADADWVIDSLADGLPKDVIV